ncbi:unnamed protein product [Rangifer tarandus platyrhynchus]|uniref:Uncharacterized protein n=1 Tax=Rangifer tarandus platyrhynchus TaxID=3082113 RepID=A0AC59ZCT6_RANTA
MGRRGGGAHHRGSAGAGGVTAQRGSAHSYAVKPVHGQQVVVKESAVLTADKRWVEGVVCGGGSALGSPIGWWSVTLGRRGQTRVSGALLQFPPLALLHRADACLGSTPAVPSPASFGRCRPHVLLPIQLTSPDIIP